MKLRYKIAALLCLGLVYTGVSQTLIETIPLPNTTYWNSAYGMVYANAKYWISSGSGTTGRGLFYAVNATGDIVDSVRVTNYPGLRESQGLAFDGTNFWYVERKTARCDLFKISPAGLVVDSIPIVSVGGTTSWLLGGAAWDGTGLWVSLYSPDLSAGIYKIDVIGRQIVDTIPVQPGQLQPTGITVKGDTLFYVNDGFQGVDRVYAVSLSTKDTLFSFNLPDIGQRQNPRGLAWDGSYFWILAEPVGASTGRSLFKYVLSGSGTPIINVPIRFFDHGRIRIGNTQQVTAIIQNMGTADLHIDSVRILYSSQFTTNLTTPHVIPAGSSSNFTITFTPTVYGVDSAHVVLYHNDPARQPQVIRTVAMGIYPSAHLGVPSSNDYGPRRVNSSTLWIMRIENRGATTLQVDSASFSTGNFSIDGLPLVLDSVSSRNVRVWFTPSGATIFSDSMRLYSNSSNLSVVTVGLSGSGDATPLPLGTPFWTHTVPLHPNSNTTRRVRAVRSIGDITGDGKRDVIVCTDNYWTMALNGNASGQTDSLWGFSTYISNFSAGPIGSEGSYSYQKALAIASDLNNDGYNDVVIGTGGGNEHVYAISGRTGQMIWTFGRDDSAYFGDFDGVDASTDFTGDGVPDVIAASQQAIQPGGGTGGRRRIYLFNGANGQILWDMPLLGYTHGVTAIGDVSGDGTPDVIGTVGESEYKASAFSGANGTVLWNFVLASSTGGAKEVLALPIQGQTPDVILGAFWGPIYRLDGETGNVVWQRSTGSKDPTRMVRLRDLNNDGIDEIVVSLLVGDAWCLDGATGNILWSYPANSGMDITTIPDLNNDGFDEVAVASQNNDVLLLRGQTGQLLYQHIFPGGSEQARSVALLNDIDGNSSDEIIAGSDLSNVVLLSGGLDAGPTGVGDSQIPVEFSVSQNYPNPFNPSTAIEVRLPAQTDLTVRIFDILGREVRSFEYMRIPPGVHRIVWDGRNAQGAAVASGVYFYRVQAGETLAVRRMVMLK